MNDRLIYRLLTLCWVLFCSIHTSQGEDLAPPTDHPKFALLVGVGEYLSDRISDLDGCANDIQVMQTLLKERFGFDLENDVIVLVDEAATGDGIRAAMRKLEQRVQALPKDGPPAQVVFHFSGHGSRVMDQEDGPDADERDDGLDETLVPHDATRQGSDADIRDDELNYFAQKICEDGRTRLWMILDCCHSGSAARGATKVRKLDRDLPTRKSTSTEQKNVSEKTLPANAVALYACLSKQQEPEYPDGDKSYGLLTRFLVQVLNEQRKVSEMSYEMLVDAIVTRYRQDSKTIAAPTPRVEGNLRDIVCGAGTEADHPAYWKVLKNGNNREQVIMTAGALHGVTVGSLFELYERPEQVLDNTSPSLVWLRIDEVNGASATASVMEKNGDDLQPTRLERDFEEGFAIERHHQHGEFSTRVRVERYDSQTDQAIPLSAKDEHVPQAIRNIFAVDDPQAADSSNTWLSWAEPGEPFDLLLRVDEDFAAVLPVTGVSSPVELQIAKRDHIPESLRGGWGGVDGPIDLRQEKLATETIANLFKRVTRARNLIRLVETQKQAPHPNYQVQLRLDQLVVKVEDGELAVVDRAPWPLVGTDQLTVQESQFYDWEILYSNRGSSPVYVTVLQIDANMGIQTMLPYQKGDVAKMVYPDEMIQIGGFQLTGDTEEQPTIFGPRWTILLSTKEPNYFSMLEQTSLPTVRGSATSTIGPPGRRGEPQALETLLLQETYFANTRGDRPLFQTTNLYDESWSVDIVQWIAVRADAN